EPAGAFHGASGATEDGNDFRGRETIQKLAHPDYVEPARKGLRFIQQVDGEKIDALLESVFSNRFPGQFQLRRKIGDGDLHVWIEPGALKRPFAGISTDIEQAPGRLGKNQRQSGLERQVRVVMVKSQPTLPRLRRERGQALIKGLPISQGFQA